jgi:hypothetical protein
MLSPVFDVLELCLAFVYSVDPVAEHFSDTCQLSQAVL